MKNEMLQEARRAIQKRRAMYGKAAELSKLLGGATFQGVTITVRCDQTHQRGRRPKLAEAAIVDGHLLFVSKIDWMPSDELTLRPWQRDSLEGPAMSDEVLATAMVDDEFLKDMIDRHDQWAAGIPATGERWLQRVPRFVLTTALPLSEINQPPATGLWVRCPDHASEPENCDPLSLVEATR